MKSNAGAPVAPEQQNAFSATKFARKLARKKRKNPRVKVRQCLNAKWFDALINLSRGLFRRVYVLFWRGFGLFRFLGLSSRHFLPPGRLFCCLSLQTGDFRRLAGCYAGLSGCDVGSVPERV